MANIDYPVNTVVAQNDLRFPATRLRQGALLKPDFDETDVALLFPQNDTSEVVFIIAQMPHSWKEGSDIYPHVHVRLEGTGQAVFKLEYKWYNIVNDIVPTSWTSYTMNVGMATWTSDTISDVIYGSAPISGAGKTVSSILIMKLYRDDNVYVGDIKVDEFDIHYDVEKFGKTTDY